RASIDGRQKRVAEIVAIKAALAAGKGTGGLRGGHQAGCVRALALGAASRKLRTIVRAQYSDLHGPVTRFKRAERCVARWLGHVILRRINACPSDWMPAAESDPFAQEPTFVSGVRAIK